MIFSPDDHDEFYAKLVADGENATPVPTIDAWQAQATVDSDRARIFKVGSDFLPSAWIFHQRFTVLQVMIHRSALVWNQSPQEISNSVGMDAFNSQVLLYA